VIGQRGRPGAVRGAASAVVAGCSVAAALLSAHTALNARLLRRPPAPPYGDLPALSVLLPVRNEGHQVAACLQAALTALPGPRSQLVVLDDGSTDDTVAVVQAAADTDPRVTLVHGTPPPPGWLGKPHACAQLAAIADPGSEVLVFLDADVELAPHALSAAVALLNSAGLDLVSPYPRQRAETAAERLVQPLLQWSWLTFLPLRLAERSPRPSLSAANGQLLVVRRPAYERCGGHAAVRGEVLDDVALARAVKAGGGRGGVADGTALATCRMYAGWAALRDGYAKSLWSAFGSPAGAAAAVALLAGLYVLPPVAALRGSRAGRIGYAAGVVGRVVAARRTGARAWPDALAHPASVSVLCWLIARSAVLHRRGQLAWKGRPL